MNQTYKFEDIKGILPRLVGGLLKQDGWIAVLGGGETIRGSEGQLNSGPPRRLMEIVANWIIPNEFQRVSVVIDHPDWGLHFTTDPALSGFVSKNSITELTIRTLREDLQRQQEEALAKEAMPVLGTSVVKNLRALLAKCWELGYDPYVVIEHDELKHNERLFFLSQHHHGVEYNRTTAHVIHDTEGIVLTFGSLGRCPNITHPRNFKLKSFHALDNFGKLAFTLDETKTFIVFDNEIKKVFLEG